MNATDALTFLAIAVLAVVIILALWMQVLLAQATLALIHTLGVQVPKWMRFLGAPKETTPFRGGSVIHPPDLDRREELPEEEEEPALG